MSTILTIGIPAAPAEGFVSTPVIIHVDETTVVGATVIHERGDRVWASTTIDNRQIVHDKLDPNDPKNAFDVIVGEIARFNPVSLPMTTDDIEAIARVAHAIVTNGRQAW